MNEDQTVQITPLPHETSAAWLGVGSAAAGLSWLATFITLIAIKPNAGLLISAGLGVSVTISVITVAAWTRHNLAATAARQQAELHLLSAGQYTLAMAELRSLRRVVEQHAAHATVERQALSAKLSMVKEEGVGYWHGVADTVEQVVTGTDSTVVPFRGRAHVPQDR